MPDQEVPVAQMLAAFKEGQAALTEALELMEAQEPEMAAFHSLLEATCDLADQAQVLVLLLKDDGADIAALQDANDLAAFFWTTEEHIEAKLGLGWA